MTQTSAAQDITDAQSQVTQINGKTFYLKKTRRNFWSSAIKTFVVIYSEPDNSEQVETALKTHLPHLPLKITSELGITRFEFK